MFKAARDFDFGDQMVSRGIRDKVEVLTVTYPAYVSLNDENKVWIEFDNERRLFDIDAQLEFINVE